MEGENFVSLVGKLTKVNYKLVGEGEYPMLKAVLAIPTSDGNNQYIKVCAWYGLAEALNEVDSKAFIKVHGHIEESSFNSKCRLCGGSDKKYWTEVVISNFVVLQGE